MEFSNTQMQLLRILRDGKRHHRDQLIDVLPESDVPLDRKYRNLSQQLCTIRKTLRPIGQDIICELHCRMIHYRHIRLLTGPNTAPLSVRLATPSVRDTTY